MATTLGDTTHSFEAVIGRAVDDGLDPVGRSSEQGRMASRSEVTACSSGLHNGWPSSIAWDPDILTPVAILKIFLLYSRQARELELVAVRLLARFGSLGGILAAEPIRLREADALDDSSIALFKTVQAAIKCVVREPLQDRPIIGSGAALMDYLSVVMRHDATEHLRILFLDRRNALIRDEVVQRGTIDHVPLYPRELVKRVLELGASAIIMVHNHPSGDPAPSRADIDMTRQVVNALAAMDLVLHDHVIVGRNTEASFRKLGLL